jgi:hypothetical protein
LGVVGGIALIVGLFVDTGRVAPRWTRVAVWISGPASVVWGVLGYSLSWGLRDTYGLLRYFKTLSGGIATGILAVLIGSGEFGKPLKRNTNRQ